MLRAPMSLEKMTYDAVTGMVICRSKMHAGLKRNFQVTSGAAWLELLCRHIPDRYEHALWATDRYWPCSAITVRELRVAAGHQLAADDDAALGEIDLLPDLPLYVPSRLRQGRRDELGAEVAFGEVFPAHPAPRSRLFVQAVLH